MSHEESHRIFSCFNLQCSTVDVIRGCKKKKYLLRKKHQPVGVERQYGPAQQLSALSSLGTSEAKLKHALVGQLIDWDRKGHPDNKHGKHQAKGTTGSPGFSHKENP